MSSSQAGEQLLEEKTNLQMSKAFDISQNIFWGAILYFGIGPCWIFKSSRERDRDEPRAETHVLKSEEHKKSSNEGPQLKMVIGRQDDLNVIVYHKGTKRANTWKSNIHVFCLTLMLKCRNEEKYTQERDGHKWF